MNTSTLFKNAVLNLYKKGIYTVDYAIIKTEELRSRNRITEEDYIEMLTFFAEEQAKELNPQNEQVEEVDEVEDLSSGESEVE